LGKLIQLKALPLVWWRVSLCCLVLVFIVPKVQYLQLPRRRLKELFVIGALVGIHWLCFYGAIKLSNASVAVATMASTSLFAAFTEPFFLKTKIKWYELGLGLLILPGMALVVGNLDWDMRTGFAVGILGAFLAAVFSAMNKKVLDNDPPPPMVMSFMELFAAVLICSAALPFSYLKNPELVFWPQGNDWLWLGILSCVCTLLPYYLTLQAMRYITAFATNLTINLEPVYGVLLAAVIFGEHHELPSGFYLGVAIILVAVFSHPFIKKRIERS
jgi:drug/metabolite transporter (DMT)-like permease